VLVTGEPGAGKTRLVEEFSSWCAARGAATSQARSYPAEGALAYGPVVAWLRSDALAGHLGRLDPARREELARLLPELRPAAPGRPAPAPPPDREQRRLLFEALAGAVLASPGPLLLVADDLHWADRETLQFLHYLLRAQPRAPLLVVATVRPGELDPEHPLHDLLTGLRALDRVAEIEVGRFSARQTAALAERLRRRPLTAPEAERLFAETEGNPLFVVEALRAGWSGQGQPAPVTPRVQAVIESRLAQLSGPARDLAGVAATIGREFSTDVLAEASQAGEAALVGGLDELWRRRLVRDQGPDDYDFTHDRIREGAYLGLSPARRRHTHLLVAGALERLHAGDPEAVAAQVAAHHERAGAVTHAVAWYERAASAAQRLPAYDEAVRLLDRALRLLRAQPPSPARRERELAVLTRLQGPLGIVDGYASERLGEVQRRALELAGELGVEPAPPLLRSAAMARLSRGDFEGARRVGERLRSGGASQGDELRAVQGDYVLGLVAFWEGEFEAARRHLQAAVDQFRPDRRSDRLARFGTTTEVLSTSRLGNTLGFLGRPEAAAAARAAALGRAAESGQPHHREAALMFGAMLALERCATRRRSGPTAPSWPPGRATWPAAVGSSPTPWPGTSRCSTVGRRPAWTASGEPPVTPTRTTTPPACTPWSRGCSSRPVWSPVTSAPAWPRPTGPSASTVTSAPGRRRLAAAGPSSWPPSAPPPTRSGRSSGVRSRSPAARAPGCWSCGPRPACSATASTPATTARQAGTGSGCAGSSTPSPSKATPPTGARRPRSLPAAERGTLPGTLLERPAADPGPIEERRPR
jgi:tetratricopeptide (TPR) repeat protein